MAFDEVKIAEFKRNHTFATRQRTNKRQSAVSLIQFTLIRYSRPCAIKKYRFKPNFPRLTLPREHANATTKAYAMPRDCSVNGGEDKSLSYPPYSTASVDSQGDGVWCLWHLLCKCGAHLRVGAAFTRRWYNQSERRKSFFYFTYLNLKWNLHQGSLLEYASSLR